MERAFGRLLRVVQKLRKECPWDRAQDIGSLKEYFLDEARELAEGIHAHDINNIIEELGDLVFLVALQSIMLEEACGLGIESVMERVQQKLIRRHPHVFRKAQMSLPIPMPAGTFSMPAKEWKAVKLIERNRWRQIDSMFCTNESCRFYLLTCRKNLRFSIVRDRRVVHCDECNSTKNASSCTLFSGVRAPNSLVLACIASYVHTNDLAKSAEMFRIRPRSMQSWFERAANHSVTVCDLLLREHGIKIEPGSLREKLRQWEV